LTSAGDKAAVGEWRQGWRVLLAASIGMMVGSVHVHTLGPMIKSLESDFGWTRAEISGSLTIIALVCGLLCPFVGHVVDRYGSRRIGIVGMFLLCGSVACLSFAGPSIMSWWLLWVPVTLGVLLVMPTVWAAAVTGAFNRQRGAALAIMLCGNGISATVLPYLTSVLITHYGWRVAYVAVSALWVLIAAPILLLFFYDRRSVDSARPVGQREKRAPITNIMRDPAVRSPKFIKLVLSCFLLTICGGGTSIHFIPMLTDRGLGRETAAAIMSLMGPAAIFGRLATGVILDRTHSSWVGSMMMTFPFVSCLLLLFLPPTPAAAAAAVVLLGIGMGAEFDVATFLNSRFFGLEKFGRLNSVLMAFLALGTGIGPFLAGAVFDHAGDYRPWLIAFAPISLLSWVLIGSMGRYPGPEETTPIAPDASEAAVKPA